MNNNLKYINKHFVFKFNMKYRTNTKLYQYKNKKNKFFLKIYNFQ